jgi:L-ascorbate metabolism protein UlaG (beta-lactamase superfamily)
VKGKGGKGRTRLWLRRLLRLGGVLFGLLAVVSGIAFLQGREALGGKPQGPRLARVTASPQWEEGVFKNPQELDDQVGGALAELVGASQHATPQDPVPVSPVDPFLFDSPPESGLRVTWLGHSTMLVEMGGQIILTDPVWGPRASPLSWLGPKRWYEPLLALEDLPPLDVVVISHDHYDHLDHPTMVALRDRETIFVVPLGVGAHLERWGIPVERIVELDWWDRFDLGDVEIVMTPARHASGRHFFDGNRTLWAGYAFLGPDHRVFFSGDTGMFPGIRDIGTRLGPFDLTMIEVGAYAQSWADWHMGPEQAVEAHNLLGGEVFLPIHWGLFNLSTHGWTEPIERVRGAAEVKGVTVWSPRPGESLEVGQPVVDDRWWPVLPWRTAEEYQVISTQISWPPGTGLR